MQLLTKGCNPKPPMPSSVLNAQIVKMIPACVSRSFSLVVGCVQFVCVHVEVMW